jgi:hypothetical protein
MPVLLIVVPSEAKATESGTDPPRPPASGPE